MAWRRYVASFLASVILLLPITAVFAAPQSIGPIPTSAEEVQGTIDALGQLSPTGWVLFLIVFLATFYVLAYKVFKMKRKIKAGPFIVSVIGALIAAVLITPWAAGFLGLAKAVGPAAACDIASGPVKLRVIDEDTGAAVTSVKVLLLTESMELDEVIDAYAKGDLDVPVRTPDSNGYVEFGDVQPGTWLFVVLPNSYAIGQPMPKAELVTVYCAWKESSDYLKTDRTEIVVPTMTSVNFVNEVGTSVSSYTWAPSSYPAELESFTVNLKPSATTGEVPKFYIYVNYNESLVSPTFKIDGTTISPTKLSDLPGDSPLRLNAPSGYTYVLDYPISGLSGDAKKALEMSATFQGNATVSFAVVYQASAERGDISGPTFTFTANNAATSTGWGS